MSDPLQRLLEAARWSNMEGETFPSDLEGVAGLLDDAHKPESATYLRNKASDLRAAITGAEKALAQEYPKMAKYPETVYVKRETDSDEPWLNAQKEVAELAELGQKTKVGVYKLVETIEVAGQVTTRKLPR